MKKITMILTAVLVCTLILTLAFPAFAETQREPATAEITSEDIAVTEQAADQGETANPNGMKAISAAALIAVVSATGAIAMAIAISKATGAMSRQPEITDKINSAMMLGLVFIETAIIYALIVAILIIFVL